LTHLFDEVEGDDGQLFKGQLALRLRLNLSKAKHSNMHPTSEHVGQLQTQHRH
jgi:hypothetical protein